MHGGTSSGERFKRGPPGVVVSKVTGAAVVVFSDGGAHASFELGKGYYAKAFAFPKFKMELESFD